jgi:hypothetical protein
LLEHVYTDARRIHLVLDNLSTHFRVCFEAVLGVRAAQHLLRRVVFHYTPKHASWLNMAEIEIGILDRRCLDRRLPNRTLLAAEVAAGSSAVTPNTAASRGPSRARMQIARWADIMFRN